MHRQLVALVLGIVVVIAVPVVRAQDQEFKVVIHVDNPISSVGQEQLARCFMKEIGMWTTGDPVIPVDQLPDSKVRAAFSKEIHGKSAAAVAELWQQRGAGGATPPAMLASDQEVLDFVRANPGAVGYVSAKTELGPGVKELTVTED